MSTSDGEASFDVPKTPKNLALTRSSLPLPIAQLKVAQRGRVLALGESPCSVSEA